MFSKRQQDSPKRASTIKSRIARLRPSPAMVVACLALFVAVGGSAYAAVQLKPSSVKSKHIRSGAVKSKHIKDGQVKTADLAVDAKAPSAKSADQAANAANLGGQPPSSYQRSCHPGAIKGSMVIDTDSAQGAGYVNAPVSFNCSGGQVQIRRAGIGRYFVRFVGNPLATSAVATASSEGAANAADNHVVTVERESDPTIDETVFLVKTYVNFLDNGSTLADGRSFTLLAY